MDASENSAFLHIQNHGSYTPMGNMYISDGTGRFYSLSIENVLRGVSFVDFEKINSLEGVYVVNKYDVKHSHNWGSSGNIDPERLDIESQAVSRLGNVNGGSSSAKQGSSRASVSKIGMHEEENDLNQNVRTFISFNKGGKWDLLKAPEKDSNNKDVKCSLED